MLGMILLILQAIIQHIICLFGVSTYSIGLSFDITFGHHLGEAWCNVPWYGGTYGAAYRTFGGLGISINTRDHYPTVISPIEGTPAFFMGIQGGDQIIEVEGEFDNCGL